MKKHWIQKKRIQIFILDHPIAIITYVVILVSRRLFMPVAFLPFSSHFHHNLSPVNIGHTQPVFPLPFHTVKCLIRRAHSTVNDDKFISAVARAENLIRFHLPISAALTRTQSSPVWCP